MAVDTPVLDRPMFQARGNVTKSKGIAAVQADDNAPNEAVFSDLKARREAAAAMVAEAKQKFDPSNFQMLTEQERPQVFRPVAVNMPAQQPTANTAQQMQQMAAQGVQQPVHMAHGGIAGFAKGGINTIDNANSLDTSDATDTVDPTVDSYYATGARFRGLRNQINNPNMVYPVDAAAPVSGLQSNAMKKSILSPATWSDDDIDEIARQTYAVKKGQYETSTAKSAVGRGIQSLNPFRNAPDMESIIQDLKSKRDVARQYSVEKEGSAKLQSDEDARMKAITENPVPSIFATQTAEDRAAAIAKQQGALSAINNPMPNRPDEGGGGSSTPPAPEGIGTLPVRPDGTGGGFSMSATDTSIPVSGVGTPSVRPDGTGGGSSMSETDTTAKTTPPVVPPVAVPTGAVPNQTLNARSPQTEGGQLPAKNTNDYASDQEPSVKSGISQLPDRSGSDKITLEGIKADRAAQRQDNLNLALIQAGLAIAGGKSSNALTNIGEGGVTGVQAFSKGEQEARQFQRDQMSDLRAQQQASALREYQNAQLGLSGEQLKLSAATQKANEAYQSGMLTNTAESRRVQEGQFAQTLAQTDKQLTATIATAEATRDAGLVKATSEQITSQLNNLETERSRLVTNKDLQMLNPGEYAIQMDRIDRQKKLLDSKSDALQAMSANKLGITLPSAGSAPATQHKVGDPISQNGKNYRVTAVDANGKVTAADPM